jgi:5-methylcytosine-specific restriction protein A
LIPQEIQREHIVQALEEIDNEGFPKSHHSTKWDLVYEGKLYPPKWAIRIAGKYALGEEHSDQLFSGGTEANGFLEKRGFQVFPKRPAYSAYSWTVESNLKAYKILDKSAFMHRGTGIPIEVRSFLFDGDMVAGEKRQVVLACRDEFYEAHIDMDKQDNPRTQLLWNSKFSSLLKNTFPHHYAKYVLDEEPESRIILNLTRLSGFDKYEVSFAGEITETMANSDVEADEIEDRGPQSEGRVREYYGKRYERSPKNRKEAIRIHGISCNACGFNFEKVYGERGSSYIEVHHIKPIHTYEDEQPVDPRTDLITVCSNCHRMIHRKPNDILSLEDVKAVFQKMETGA